MRPSEINHIVRSILNDVQFLRDEGVIRTEVFDYIQREVRSVPLSSSSLAQDDHVDRQFSSLSISSNPSNANGGASGNGNANGNSNNNNSSSNGNNSGVDNSHTVSAAVARKEQEAFSQSNAHHVDSPPSYQTASSPMQAPAAPVQAAAPAPVPAPAAPAQQYELARALYDFKGKDRGDLSFRRNETITVLEHINNDWWRGSIDKRHGIFPSNYVEIIRSPVYGSGHTGSPMPPMPVQQPQPTGPVMQPMPMAPMPYAQPMAVQPMPAQPVIVQQEAPQKHSKLGDLGSNIGNAFVFGAAATAGADIINSIF